MPTFKGRGFTLIEMLVVTGIVAILAGLLFPTLSRTKANAHLARCGNNLRQISLATSLYVSDNRTFPVFAQYGSSIAPSTFWSDRLQKYLRASWVSGEIYRCPAWPGTNRPGVFTAQVCFPPKGSYDMNGFGMSANGGLGIGGRINDHQPNRGLLHDWGP